MIEQATRHRVAGDWPAACAAAGVRVAFDLAAVAREHGVDAAARIEDDLRHLAPDLLRWHLPRSTLRFPSSALAPNLRLPLYGDGEVVPDRTPVLRLRTPRTLDGPQRLVLDVGIAHGVVGLPRYLWDARHAGELRERCGGSAERAPFFRPDGTPLAPGELPAGRPVGDPAARTEWLTGLDNRGRYLEAWHAAGLDLDRTPRASYTGDGWPVQFRRSVDRLPVALGGLAARVRRLQPTGVRLWLLPRGSWYSVAITAEGQVRLADEDDRKAGTELPDWIWRRLPDLDLLRFGRIGPDDLHPLVRSALFPARPAGGGPVEPAPLHALRVRCRGEWHRLVMAGGRLHSEAHAPEEERHELVMGALGGAVSGCFAALRAWRTGQGRLPTPLRLQRHDLLQRARHGDTPGVLRFLDAGFEPAVRDGGGKTLLHLLAWLDHEVLLDRLLAAGLSLDDRDRAGRTPLQVAGEQDAPALAAALRQRGTR